VAKRVVYLPELVNIGEDERERLSSLQGRLEIDKEPLSIERASQAISIGTGGYQEPA
jgi:hypothetical protein